jgi:transcriptional regulator with XRE-family HTH domain
MAFGKILKKIRQDNNLTQEELAKKINSSRSNIANYENEKNMPSIEILEKLSKTFNVSIDYLLGKTEIRNIEELKKIQFANSGGLDVSELDYEDLLELQRQIDYIKKMKNKGGK